MLELDSAHTSAALPELHALSVTYSMRAHTRSEKRAVVSPDAVAFAEGCFEDRTLLRVQFHPSSCCLSLRLCSFTKPSC